MHVNKQLHEENEKIRADILFLYLTYGKITSHIHINRNSTIGQLKTAVERELKLHGESFRMKYKNG